MLYQCYCMAARRGCYYKQMSGDLRHFTWRIPDIWWYQFITNSTVLDQTKEESIFSRIWKRRLAVFGHIHWLPEQAPAHAALRLAADTRSGRKPDNRQQWRRTRGRPRNNTRIQQVEVHSGLSADAAWDTAGDRCRWGLTRPLLVIRSWWRWWLTTSKPVCLQSWNKSTVN